MPNRYPPQRGLQPPARRPQPGGPIQEIPIPLERAGEGWLAQAVKETAQRRREEKASP